MKRNANTATATVAVVADNTAWTFTATTIALTGHEFPVSKYDVTDKGDVYVLASVEGMGIRLHAGHKSPRYHEALEAAMAYKAMPKAAAKPAEPAAEPAKPVETKAAEPAKQAKPATKRKAKPAAEPAKPVEAKAEAKPAPAAKQPKAAKPAAKAAKQPAAKPAAKPAAEPAKPVVPADGSWIGTAIEGKGWRIAFDEAAQRTRVIAADPSAKQKAAIEAAGFYWSATTKSWNKKLTRKAYRAAVALAESLNAIA